MYAFHRVAYGVRNFGGDVSVLLLSVVFITFSVLHVGDGTEAMSYFDKG